jgi:hypothetical protein
LLKLSSKKDPILTLFSQLPIHTIQNQDPKKKKAKHGIGEVQQNGK